MSKMRQDPVLKACKGSEKVEGDGLGGEGTVTGEALAQGRFPALSERSATEPFQGRPVHTRGHKQEQNQPPGCRE